MNPMLYGVLAALFTSTWLLQVSAKAGLCEVETGQSNIILDIEESRDSYVDQRTNPAELPIVGDPFTEISLDLVFPKGKVLFILNGKKLQLLQPLDRDAENLSHIVFQLTCLVKSTNKKRTIPIIVRVSDVNDNAPAFVNTPYETTVPELTPIGTTIFQGILARDADAGVNGLVEYFIEMGDGTGLGQDSGVGNSRITSADGYGYFSINLPHQGQVTVNRTLDYERTQRYLLTLVASDRARNASERMTATTTLTINIQDADDQDPSFIYQGCVLLDGACINPEYTATVSSGVLSGILLISPEKIQAVDMDTLQAPIRYSFLSGTPADWADYFEIHQNTGAVRQVRAIDTVEQKRYDLIVKAQEVSEAQRFATAKLAIDVKPVDANPPVINATAVEGFVNENAAVGTKVLDENGDPITLTVTDEDLGPDNPKPQYTFELTTPFFEIDKNGVLVVNEENLDRDPPSPGNFKFQVVARETQGNAASAPLSLSVNLIDVNDNAPKLPMLSPISIPAGESKREVTQVKATDNDIGENAIVTYSIYHVSNNGANKFKIDPDTGIIETTGKLSAGEQYSITVQASDRGGLHSQSIVEVMVAPGPNTRPPIFTRPVWEVQVSEGAEIMSTVATITAKDPEDDPVTYSIISGNDLRQFSIGSNSGVITVIRKLDREDLTRYQLLIKAEDSGKLSSTATVNIKVTDINDKNPEFDESSLPYTFKVKEGMANATVGRVHATDADEGVNAEISYSLPVDIPFAIDEKTGDITTKIALDYETQKEYQFTVTARDGAPDPRLATASVTVSVLDLPDELPVFKQTEYTATVAENLPNHLVAQVHAEDPDTVKEITYTIRQGPAELFTIHPVTGEIRTTRGLDYEEDTSYELIVGTEENRGNSPGATARVVVTVEDMNDIPPVFNTIPDVQVLNDNSPIGLLVTVLRATDGDRTSPNNKVRFELIGRGQAAKYFVLDPYSGQLRVRDDLSKSAEDQYYIDVKVYDLGEPQLSSSMTLSVEINRVGSETSDPGAGFADDTFSVEVDEDAPPRSFLKRLSIIGARQTEEETPVNCRIQKGNELGLFYINVTDSQTCTLYTNDTKLDYETAREHILHVVMESRIVKIDPAKKTCIVKVLVTDDNDNKPKFIYPDKSDKYYAAIASDSPWDTPVVQVQATDSDSGEYGKIEFTLLENEVTDQYFMIDKSSGVIKTQKTFDDVSEESLPFRLLVQARDNPGEPNNFNKAEANVVVNLISDINRMILVFTDARPDIMRGKEAMIAAAMREQSGLMVAVEKLAARQHIVEGLLETDPTATDVWFYAVDPNTDRILERNSTRIQRSILESKAQSNLTFLISGVAQATAKEIHDPVSPNPRVVTAVAGGTQLFPYALITVACVIFVLGVAGIIYICISWNKYKNFKQRLQRQYTAPSSPTRYDQVGSGGGGGSAVGGTNTLDASLKEYETQVLNMTVPQDDNDSYSNLQIDFSAKNHAFSLDNVSYITKDNVGQQSPVSSEAATTARASSVIGVMDDNRNTMNTFGRNRLNTFQRNNTAQQEINTLNRNNLALEQQQQQHLNTINRSTLNRNKNHTENMNTLNKNARNSHHINGYEVSHDLPTMNSMYQGADDHMPNASATNDNVTFGKREYGHMGFSYMNDRSPVETTTEL